MNLRLWHVPEGDGQEERVLCRLGTEEPTPPQRALRGLEINYRGGTTHSALVGMLTNWENSTTCDDLQYFTLEMFKLVATAGYLNQEVDALNTARDLLKRFPVAGWTLQPLLEIHEWQRTLAEVMQSVYDHCLKLGGHR